MVQKNVIFKFLLLPVYFALNDRFYQILNFSNFIRLSVILYIWNIKNCNAFSKLDIQLFFYCRIFKTVVQHNI